MLVTGSDSSVWFKIKTTQMLDTLRHGVYGIVFQTVEKYHQFASFWPQIRAVSIPIAFR